MKIDIHICLFKQVIFYIKNLKNSENGNAKD